MMAWVIAVSVVSIPIAVVSYYLIEVRLGRWLRTSLTKMASVQR